MDGNTIQAQILKSDGLSSDLQEMLSSAPDHSCRINGSIYLKAGRDVICLPDDPGGNELAHAIKGRRRSSTTRPTDAKDLFGKLLNDPYYLPDGSLLKELGFLPERNRCCAVFRAYSPIERDLFSILTSIAPIESGDALVPADYQTAVLIKDVDGQPPEEMKEFIEAVIGTMEYEGIPDIRAGIGRGYSDMTGIRSSYQEASQALETGIRHHSMDHVFSFAAQTMERIVDSIPENRKKSILQTLFEGRDINRLPDEMMETVQVFFRNDLNLTAASKQLYIHRNTLNYRLDKIRKDYGLDLRCFQDAVIFRIVSEFMNDIQSPDGQA